MLSKVCGYISSSLHPPFAEEQPSLSTQTALACAMAKFFVCPCHHVVYFLQLCIVCCCCAQTKVFEEILFEQRQFRENARVLAQLQHYFFCVQERSSTKSLWLSYHRTPTILNQARSKSLLRRWRLHGPSETVGQKSSSILDANKYLVAFLPMQDMFF